MLRNEITMAHALKMQFNWGHQMSYLNRAVTY